MSSQFEQEKDWTIAFKKQFPSIDINDLIMMCDHGETDNILHQFEDKCMDKFKVREAIEKKIALLETKRKEAKTHILECIILGKIEILQILYKELGLDGEQK